MVGDEQQTAVDRLVIPRKDIVEAGGVLIRSNTIDGGVELMVQEGTVVARLFLEASRLDDEVARLTQEVERLRLKEALAVGDKQAAESRLSVYEEALKRIANEECAFQKGSCHDWMIAVARAALTDEAQT